MGSTVCARRIDFVLFCFVFLPKVPKENRGLHYFPEHGFSTLVLLIFGAGYFFVARNHPVHCKEV